MNRLRLSAIGLLLGISACTVPDLKELGDRACAPDAGHPCISPYQCLSGICRIPAVGSCTPGTTEACGKDAGQCVLGVRTCGDDGKFGDCQGDTAPTSEVCDGKDNDCDGVIDNDVPASTDFCEKQQGICAGAKRSCVDGGYETPCTRTSYGTSYEPTELSCDGKDNDCNGTADDGVNAGACPNVGVCVGAFKACVGGAAGACNAANFEAVETSCDGLDNDCDTNTDKGPDGGVLRGTGQCAKSQGVCANSSPACVSGAFEPVANCTAASFPPTYQPSELACDGLDNDCNGTVDRFGDGGVLRGNGCALTMGVCTGAQAACVDGGFEQSCTAASYGPNYQPFETRCDGLDNDCDGMDDVSASADLMQGAGGTASEVAWAQYDGGFLSVYAAVRGGKRSIYFRRFDTELQPMTAEIELSAAGAVSSRAPQLVRIGAQDAIALWVEDLPAAKRIVITKVDPDGRRFIAGTDGAVLPIAGPVNVAGSPTLAVTKDEQYILGAWVDSATNSVQGTVVSGDGTTPIQGVTTIVPAAYPDGGSELSLEVNVSGGTSANPFRMVWTSILNGGYAISARVHGTNLQELSPGIRNAMPVNVVPVWPRSVRNLVNGKVAIGWVENNTVSGQMTARAFPDISSAQVLNVVSSAQPLTAFELTQTPGGFAAVWAKQTTTGAILNTAPLDGGATTNLYGPLPTEIDALSLASGATGAIIGAAFVQDGGTAPQVRAFEFCAP